MKKMILAAAAAVGLSGCVGYGGYGTGVSIGYGSSYGGYGGYGGYGDYGGYGGYGRDCITYDRYGRAYYSCGYGGYSSRYSYSPRTVVYYYPGYTYRGGYYYDGYNRRYAPRTLYYRYYRTRRY